MTTLLRLLEPPTATSIPGIGSSSNPTITTGDKPIIFVLDEFDLFALHPRQSFLYSLLDIVQGNRRRSGVGVIGLTSRTVSFWFVPVVTIRLPDAVHFT